MANWADGNRRSPEEEASRRSLQREIAKATLPFQELDSQRLLLANWWLRMEVAKLTPKPKCFRKANGR